MYGDPLDYWPEVMELCFNCKYADCVGEHGCEERLRMVRAIKQRLGEVKEGDSAKPDLRKKYTIDGITLSGYDWIKVKGKKISTVYTRMLHGMQFFEALTVARVCTKTKKGFIYTVNGVTMTGAEWEIKLGLSKQAIARHVRKTGESGANFIKRKLSEKRVQVL